MTSMTFCFQDDILTGGKHEATGCGRSLQAGLDGALLAQDSGGHSVLLQRRGGPQERQAVGQSGHGRRPVEAPPGTNLNLMFSWIKGGRRGVSMAGASN